MKARSTYAMAFLVTLVGCSAGTSVGPEQGSQPGAGQPATRLTSEEYSGAVSDLFGLPPSSQPVALVGASASATQSADDMALSDYDSAVAIATMATSSSHLGTILQAASCSAPQGNSGIAGSACAAAFVREIAPRAFQAGPVDAPTLAGLNGVYDAVAVKQGAGFSGGIAAVIEEILQSPYFLYRAH
jgi:uncharacterized protein DUF1595